jgi:hypothetical protein
MGSSGRRAGGAVPMALLAVAAAAEAAAPGRPKGWVTQKSAEQIVVVGESEPVNYGGFSYRNDLRLRCDVKSRKIDVNMRTRVKSMGPFVVRFDAEPARQIGTAQPYYWESGHELRVPEADVAAFVEDARTRGRLLLRHDFLGRIYDVVFDLAGLEAALEPMREACGLAAIAPRPATAAARPATPATPAAPPPRQVGRWLVRESTSALDDKPVVVLSAANVGSTMVLYLRCQEAQTEAYFVINNTVFNGNRDTRTVTFEVGVDGGEPRKYVGPTTELFKAAFLPDGRAFVDSLAGHHSVELVYTPYRRAMMETAKIDITGIDKALEPLLKACPAPAR